MAKSKKYIKKSLRSSYITTVFGISIVLLTLGIVSILLLSANKIQNLAKEQIQIDVFFKDAIPESEILQLQKEFSNYPFVKNVEFISSYQALISMNNIIDDEGLNLLDGESPIPPSLLIRPNAKWANNDSLINLKNKLEKEFDIIDSFDFNERIIRQSNDGIKNLIFIMSTVGIFLFFVSLALINNTIRLSLYSKRFLIKTMQMVGATHGFIRRPFLLRFLFQGIISSLFASILVTLIVLTFSKFISNLTYIVDNTILIITFSLILTVGIFATLISVWFALNKFLKLQLDDLY